MLTNFKVLVNSRLFRLSLSAVLIFFAFRKIDVFKLLGEIGLVPWWFIVIMLIYSFVTMIYGSWKWSSLLLDKPSWSDLLFFVRAGYLGMFYSLFFPSAVAGDMLKWVPLVKKYPQISKARLATSVVIDRIIGLTAFSLVGLISLSVGKIQGYVFPLYLVWLFGGLSAGIIVFFITIYSLDFKKLFSKLPRLRRLVELVETIKAENKSRMIKCFFISFFGEPFWMMPFWFYSLIFGAGITFIQTMIFVPVISLILILPVSIAGFGARETLFLYFFTPLGFAPDKVLLVSTFGGIVGVLNALIGGVFTLF